MNFPNYDAFRVAVQNLFEGDDSASNTFNVNTLDLLIGLGEHRVYYGDNIPDAPTAERGKDNWRVRLDMAQLWVAEINKRGGDATLVHLPDEGITGGTHFLMSDLNNTQIADHIAGWLSDKKLDQ